MRIRITHKAGVGQHPYGAVVELEDRRASGLVHDGYAVMVETEKPKKPRKDEACLPSH